MSISYLEPNKSNDRKSFKCTFHKKYASHLFSNNVLLTDMSKAKAFNCLANELLMARLHALNLDMNAFKLICNYLTGRTQRFKITSSFTSYMDAFSRRAARINFRTATIQPISQRFLFICWGSWYYALHRQ